MPEPMIGLLIGAALASLIGYLCWAARQHLDRRSRKPDEATAFCVWCLFRRGDVCVHPSSPVYNGECRPVCSGVKQCEVREVVQWGQRRR